MGDRAIPGSEDMSAAFTAAASLIEEEGLLLDEARWDEWLALFTDDVRYWVPTWRGDGRLSTDPELEMSHIYYQDRDALADRVARFTSPDSPASNPRPRTTHMIGATRSLRGSEPASMMVRSSWATHIYHPRDRTSHVLFGSRQDTVVRCGEGWRIAAKTVVIQNDFIPTMLDIYCL